jgi:hypothetical protein
VAGDSNTAGISTEVTGTVIEAVSANANTPTSVGMKRYWAARYNRSSTLFSSMVLSIAA